jgi:hypothetical protein
MNSQKIDASGLVATIERAKFLAAAMEGLGTDV